MNFIRAAFTTFIPLALVAAGCAETPDSPLSPDAPAFALGASGLVLVTSAADVGTGSFRAAVDEANTHLSIRRIQFHPGLTAIQLESPVEFDGPQDLEIQGRGNVLDGTALGDDETNFLATGGGDLEIRDLTVRDAPGHGLIVQVPDDATGTQRVVLRNVSALDNLGHGVEINDQEDPDDAGDPDNGIRGNSNGSDASLEAVVLNSTFSGNGFGALDRDGLRVNEGGDGDLDVTIQNSRADDNGADGVELDERGEGSAIFEVHGSHFARNGDFDQSAEPDKDDGFDADEIDGGDMIATVTSSTANDNFEEGFDFNENDAGDQIVVMSLVETSRNLQEGLDLEEDDDWQGGGDLIATLDLIVANGNGIAGDGGVKIRERGDGNLEAELKKATAEDNESAGIHVREQGSGNLLATVENSTATGNGLVLNEDDEFASGIFLREDDAGDHLGTVRHATADGNGVHGIDFDENSGGNLTAAVAHTSASDNTEEGIRADEGGAGAGTLPLTEVTMTGNGAPGTAGNVVP